MSTVISVENLSKSYRLGALGGRTLRDDLSRWWAKGLRRPDPTLKIGQEHLADRIGKEFQALKDVSFSVREGEVLGVIGRNGAGKSTLLKILSRVTAPTEGRIRLRGRVASLLEVGTGFHPDLTGRENIFMNGVILGMTRPEIATKFDAIVHFAGTEQFVDTPVKRYSSGMYVRLAFAVAAHLDSEILIVDEVLAVGDAEFQSRCLGKMQDVASSGRTVLFVSHTMPTISRLCDRAAVLADGTITHNGGVDEAIEHYSRCGLRVAAEADLRVHPGRTPASQSLAREVRVLDEKGLPSSRIRMGSPFSIEVIWQSAADIVRPQLGLGVETQLGTRVLTFRTGLDAGYVAPPHARAGCFRCMIPVCQFTPGTYTITLSLGDAYRDLDRVEGAARFEVQETDVFGTGEIPARGQGNMWQQVRFHLCDQRAAEQAGGEGTGEASQDRSRTSNLGRG
jgi:lipopolysaccharide transport system ATP-binding protein